MIPRKFDLDYATKALLRRKWYIIIPFLLTCSSGVIYTLTMPKMYKASALILVQRQQVPSSYVASNVAISLREVINNTVQQVTSRTNLENIIKSFGLYSTKNRPSEGEMMQDKIERMRDNIKIQVDRTSGIEISFVDTNPTIVAKIANKLASNFVEEHLRVRAQQSTGTTKFLEAQLARVGAALREKEERLTAFKLQHMGGLPTDLDTNLRLMGQLNQKLSSLEQRLDAARRQESTFQQQMANLEKTPAFPSLYEEDFLALEDAASPELAGLKQTLEALRFTYTEKHPDVVKVQKMIQQIEESQEQESAAEETEVMDDGIVNHQLLAFEVQNATLKDIKRDILAEKARIAKQISNLRNRIDETPRRQLVLNSLNSEYRSIKAQYDSLLQKKLQSELAENLEKRQKGEQFTIVDRAKHPAKPFSPNVARLILISVLAAFAAGFGVAFAVEYLDKSFRDFADLVEFTQMPILATMPLIDTSKENSSPRVRVFAYCVGGCLLLVVCIGIFLWLNGNIYELLQRIRSLV